MQIRAFSREQATPQTPDMAPTASRSCLPCYSRRRACDKALPRCGRCVRAGQSMSELCSYRFGTSDADLLRQTGARIMDASEFRSRIEEKPMPSGRTQRTACRACRTHKKQCDLRAEGCSRCRSRGLDCSYAAEDDQETAAALAKARLPPPLTFTLRSRKAGAAAPRAADTSTIHSKRTLQRQPEPPSPGDSSSSSLGPISGSSESPDDNTPKLNGGSASLPGEDNAVADDIVEHVPTQQQQQASSFEFVGAEELEGSEEDISNYQLAPHTFINGFPALPGADIVNFYVDSYFSEVEMALPNVSAGSLFAASATRARRPSNLLLTSILLVGPHLHEFQVANPVTGVGQLVWDSALFPRIQAELPALLDQSNTRELTVDDCSALINLAVWSMFRGLNGLRKQFMHLVAVAMRQLLQKCSEAGNKPPTHSRQAWLDYWEPQRALISTLVLLWRESEWVMDIHGNPDFDLRLMDRPAPPYPIEWETANTDPNFHPASLPEPPMISDAFSFLKYKSTDPRRAVLLQLASPKLLDVRFGVNFLSIIMRQRVDRFLAACHLAGIQSPAQLPLEDSPDLDPIQRTLIAQRGELDATLLQTKAAFPPAAAKAIEEADAAALVNLMNDNKAPFMFGFNYAPNWYALRMLRVDLYTSFGTMFTLPGVNLELEFENLAREFAGGPLYLELLEEVSLVRAKATKRRQIRN